jgi:hypothetical protein
MNMIFSPIIFSNWYWIVGGDQANVYSSARVMTVPVDDPDYVAWQTAGGVPSAANSMDDVIAVCATNYPRGTLVSYNADARYRHATGGLIVTSISPVPFVSDPVARNSLANANEYVKQTPGSTINFKLSDGSFVVLDGNALSKATVAMATFVQNCFTCESNNLTAINGGSITTLQQIDDAFAAISNTFP